MPRFYTIVLYRLDSKGVLVGMSTGHSYWTSKEKAVKKFKNYIAENPEFNDAKIYIQEVSPLTLFVILFTPFHIKSNTPGEFIE